jgi:hypothetical protein
MVYRPDNCEVISQHLPNRVKPVISKFLIHFFAKIKIYSVHYQDEEAKHLNLVDVTI